jgi:hypothetical protein
VSTAKDQAIDTANARDGFPTPSEGVRRRLPVLTNSQAKTFRRCAREHFYAYILGYRTATLEEALYFGDLLHAGLEVWWLAKMHGGEPLEAAIEALRGKARDEYDLVRAGALLQGYDARWTDEPFEVLAVEREFRAPIVNPETGAASRTYEAAGKLDVVVRDTRDNLVKMIEHKSSSEDITAGSTYWKRLILDSQVSTYFAGGKAAGYDIAECVYDVIGKPGQRPASVPLVDELGCKIVLDASGARVRTKTGKWRETGDTAQGYVLQTRPETPDEFRQRLTAVIAESPDRYYQRGTVVRLEEEERDAAHDLWATARLIREAELAGRHPRNADACERWGRLCAYFPVCTKTASLEDVALYRKVEHVHEELDAA